MSAVWLQSQSTHDDDGDDLFSHELQLVPVILVTYFSPNTLTSDPAPFTFS